MACKIVQTRRVNLLFFKNWKDHLRLGQILLHISCPDSNADIILWDCLVGSSIWTLCLCNECTDLLSAVVLNIDWPKQCSAVLFFFVCLFFLNMECALHWGESKGCWNSTGFVVWTLPYNMWHSLAKRRAALSLYVREAGILMFCSSFCILFLVSFQWKFGCYL